MFLRFSILRSHDRCRGKFQSVPNDGFLVAFCRGLIPNGAFLPNDKLLAFPEFSCFSAKETVTYVRDVLFRQPVEIFQMRFQEHDHADDH